MSANRKLHLVRILILFVSLLALVAGTFAPNFSVLAAGAARKAGPHIMPFTPPGKVSPLFAPAGAHLTYYGGPVVSNALVEDVFWGSSGPWTTSGGNAGPGGSMPAFYNAVGSSAYFDWLTEYNTNLTAAGGQAGTNQVIGHASALGETVITPSVANNGSTIDDVNMQAELATQLNAHSLPAPTLDAAGNVNTIYALFFPDGKTLTQGGSTGGVAGGWCAYHGTIVYQGHDVPYMVLPAITPGSGYASGCGTASTLFGDFTSVTSHELVETVTDTAVGLATAAAPPLAWYDNTNGEIGDICDAQQGTIAGYVVQTQFSNVAGNCIVTRPLTNDFSLSAAPTALTVYQGGSNSTTISAAVVSGSAGTVNLSASFSPADPNLTAIFSPAAITAGGGGSSLAIVAGSSAAPGPYTVTVSGTDGVNTHSTTVSLTVSSADFSLSATPASLSLLQGTTGTATIGTQTMAGAPGTVSLSVSGAPAGVTTSLNPTSVTSGGSATLTVAVDPSAVPGPYTLTVTGVEGSSTHNATVSLTVTAPVVNDFSIGASPASLSLTQGASGTSAISTAVTSGSAGTVSLGVSGAPAGVTASLSPASVSAGGSSTLTVTVAASAAPGSYTLTVTGTEGSAAHFATVTLTITASLPPFPTTLVLDAFNRANGGVGGNWSGATSLFSYFIYSHVLDAASGGRLVWKPTSFGASQEAFVTLSIIDSRRKVMGLVLKVQTGSSGTPGAIVVAYDATTKKVRLSSRRMDDSVLTQYADTSAVFANGDQLGAQVLANGTVKIYRNGILIVTISLNAVDQAFFNSRGGKIGLTAGLGPNQAAFDNFGGGTTKP